MACHSQVAATTTRRVWRSLLRIAIAEVACSLEERGVLKRHRHDYADRMIVHLEDVVGHDLHDDLKDFYHERIEQVGEFRATWPGWDSYHARWGDELTLELLPAKAIPLFGDGCGNWWGVDLTSNDQVPAVYFFDHEDGFERPQYAAGSSLGAFLLLLADHDRAFQEKWPTGWELRIDPDIDKCPRAPPIWLAG